MLLSCNRERSVQMNTPDIQPGCCKTAVSMHKFTAIPDNSHPPAAVKDSIHNAWIQNRPAWTHLHAIFLPNTPLKTCPSLFSQLNITEELTTQLKILTHAFRTCSLPSTHYTIILCSKCDTYCWTWWLQLADVKSTISRSFFVAWATYCRLNSLSFALLVHVRRS